MRNSIIDLLSTGKSYRTWQIAKYTARFEPGAKSYINTRPYIKELKNLQADGVVELDPISTGKDKVWRLKKS